MRDTIARQDFDPDTPFGGLPHAPASVRVAKVQHEGSFAGKEPTSSASFIRVLGSVYELMQEAARAYLDKAHRTADDELRELLQGLGHAREKATNELGRTLKAVAPRRKESGDAPGIRKHWKAWERTTGNGPAVQQVLAWCKACEQFLMERLDELLDNFDLPDMTRAGLVGQRLITLRLMGRVQHLLPAQEA